MSVSLAKLARNDGKNTPGYSKLYFAYEKDVSTIPAAAAGDVATAITMVATKLFYEIEFDQEKGAYSTSEEQAGEGQYGGIRTTINFHMAGGNAAIKSTMEKFMGVPGILIGKRKSDGVHEILGEVGLGIVLKFAQTSSGRAGNDNGYEVTGNQDFNHLPYDYSDGTITTS